MLHRHFLASDNKCDNSWEDIMPYVKSEYVLFKRKLKSGKSVWYYYVYDENDRRLPRSTGERTKAKALDYVMKRRDEGLLGVADKKSQTLNEFCKDMFIKGKCPIEKELNTRGKTFAGNTMRNRRISLTKHILPYLGKTRVTSITSAQVNDWLVNLPEKDGLSRSTSNQQLDTLSTVMKFAVKKGIIQNNPCQGVENLGDDSTARPAFTILEVEALIGEQEDWNNPLIRLMCMTASVTGMRVGEVLALRRPYVFPDHIDVKYSISPEDGLKSTKTNKPRIVPITPYLYNALEEWMPSDPEKYIFSVKGDKPYTESTIARAINVRCRKLGFDEGKTFHSFRAFVDSLMVLKNFNETTVRKVIGHSDKKMTEHYLHMDVGETSLITGFQEEVGRKYLIDKKK